jgi:hypothetical protein
MGLVICVGVCVCVCLRARALFVVEWPGFFSLVEVVFSIGVLGYVHSLGCGRGGGVYGWWVFKRVSKMRWGIWYVHRLGDCWL